MAPMPRVTILRDLAHRAAYSRAACIYKRVPAGVAFPRDGEDLLDLVRFCRNEAMPLTMRGGGSGLAGQTVGEGVIADVSRSMAAIRSIDAERLEAVVQPGVVLSTLNRALGAEGLWFPPDPSSQDFCTIGGMLSNNSKGSRSVKHGTTLEHVRWLRLLLADGSETLIERGFRHPRAYGHPALRAVAELLARRRGEILSRWPRTRTNASGYNLKDCVDTAAAPDEAAAVDLIPLFVGAEGTLAVILEAGLSVCPVPKHRSLSMLEFGSVEEAGRAVVALLSEGPSACEILDETFLDIIRGGGGAFPLPVREAARAILLVESDGGDLGEVEHVMDRLLGAASAGAPLGVRRADSPEERTAIWSFRKAASPLLNKGRGALKSTRFIEDGVVAPEAIPAYLRDLRGILAGHGIEAVIFGHAGDGNFHVNPFLDLTDPATHRKVPSIALEVARLLGDLKGSLSGEHGDGRLRTPYLPEVYGSLTALFREIKLLLDPGEILNPGIIAPAEAEPIGAGLRFYPGYRRAELPGNLADPAWAVEAERCHGCGTCRTFCPTAQATGHDLLSSRGRGHLLQALLDGQVDDAQARSKGLRDLFESCLGCSRCADRCPTGVDIAPLASAFRHVYTPALARLRDSFFASLPSLGYVTGPGPGRALLRLGGTRPVRLASRAVFGVRTDQAPPVPAAGFAFDPGRLYRYPGTGVNRAVYFYGCYGNIYNPSGEAALAVSVLRALGVEVVVPPQACCGISKTSRGLYEAAAEDAAFNRGSLEPWIREGYALVGTSPSCILALRRALTDAGGNGTLGQAPRGIFDLIREMWQRDGLPAGGLQPVRCGAVYQTPCHGAAAGTTEAEVAVLERIPGLRLLDVTEECCGLAGSYGAEARRAALSDAIAAPLVERIRKAAPDLIVTPCGSCRTRIGEATGRPVVHPVEILAASLGIEAPNLPSQGVHAGAGQGGPG